METGAIAVQIAGAVSYTSLPLRHTHHCRLPIQITAIAPYGPLPPRHTKLPPLRIPIHLSAQISGGAVSIPVADFGAVCFRVDSSMDAAAVQVSLIGMAGFACEAGRDLYRRVAVICMCRAEV